MLRSISWMLAAVMAGALLATEQGRADDASSRVVLAIHGGCGVVSRRDLSPETERDVRAALDASLQAGYAALQHADGTSLDAVEAAIKVLEDSPLFNAGKGAVFTRDGRNELDAAIMDGGTRRAGAVAGVTVVKNPIVAARLVMEKSRHVLLAGPGADAFAKEAGAEIVSPKYFWTQRRWDELQEALRKEKEAERPDPDAPLDRNSSGGPKRSEDQSPDAHRGTSSAATPDHRYGTVGAVALDRRGNLAAGTSTGGLSMKRYGRVGDSPIIGAGTFADHRSCAVSGTGDGEFFLRVVAAHDIAALVEYKGLSIAAASEEVIQHKIKDAGGDGGVIVLDPQGRVAMTYNTEGMYRGYVTGDGKTHVFIYRD